MQVNGLWVVQIEKEKHASCWSLFLKCFSHTQENVRLLQLSVELTREVDHQGVTSYKAAAVQYWITKGS